MRKAGRLRQCCGAADRRSGGAGEQGKRYECEPHPVTAPDDVRHESESGVVRCKHRRGDPGTVLVDPIPAPVTSDAETRKK
jgi:hypothetical protein